MKIIDGAESFFLKGGNSGVLLIHGFTGLPTELLLLGRYLNLAGFSVLCPRLAGHGTHERDLIRTSKDDWFNSVLDAYSVLSGMCEKIFVVGHSMGGILALKLAAQKKIEGLATLAAPIFIASGMGVEKLPPKEFCKDLYVVRPRRNLHDVPPAVNEVYRKMPLPSVNELVELIDEVKKILPEISVPILILHGEEDHTANPKSAEYIAENVSSEKIRLVKVPDCGHLLPLTDKRDFVFEEVKKFFLPD